MLQKVYVTDLFTVKQMKKIGELQQYPHKRNHEVILTCSGNYNALWKFLFKSLKGVAIVKITNDIQRAVKHLNSNASIDSKKNDIEIGSLTTKVVADLKKGTYDFSNFKSIRLKQGAKKRQVKQYELFSTENILCQYTKQILDKRCKVKYPNRNKTVRALFDFLKAVKQMSEFTIIKFDFKDYFNSVSSSYVFEKYVKDQMIDRAENELISKFVRETKYSYAGLNTSNIFAEIIATRFDELVRQAFSQHGMIFFNRYIDDTFIVLNQHLEKSVCFDILNTSLRKVYYDTSISDVSSCKTKFNWLKFKMITRRELNASPALIDFLGYEFFFQKDTKGKVLLQYGITEEKRSKYNSRIDKIIEDYIHDKDIELLRHRVSAFASRTVYITKKYNNNVWKVKGFTNNYGELRFLIDQPPLHIDTANFLKNMIKDAFHRNSVQAPYFLKGHGNQRGYNLLKNMDANKTLLLVEHIGYDKAGLEKLCKQIGIVVSNKAYGTLVREYLIKIKVGY